MFRVTNRRSGIPDLGYVRVKCQEEVVGYCVMTNDGRRADSSNIEHFNRAAGVCTEHGHPGIAIHAVYYGIVSNSIWNWTPNSEIFLNGTELSMTPPSTGWIQCIGHALDNETIFVDLKIPVKL
jgi:hypothetical protein